MQSSIVLILTLLCLGLGNAHATHLRAADVQVERVCGTLTFRITVIAYLNSQSGTRFGTNSEIIFGDNTVERIPITESTSRPDLGANVSIATYTILHTYNAPGNYTITYIERDRSSGVLNIRDSHDVPYVTSIKIDTDDAYGCNHYPVLSVVPLDRGCSKIIFYHNPGAYDVDGDSLSYKLSIPASSETTFAVYDDPSSAKFYTDYNAGNEEANGKPTFSIDSLSGLITWNSPGAAGEYNIAIKIIEWRKKPDGAYVQLSTTTRDMQIIIEECENTRPDVQIPSTICVVAGEIVNSTILGTDAENHPVKIELFSEVLELDADNNPAQYSPDPADFTSSNTAPQTTFEWQTSCLHVRQQPYQIVVKITDKPLEGPKLVTFKTWNIRVVAPPPDLSNAALDPIRKNGIVNWNAYTCENASSIQIWRKVGSYAFDPGSCNIGIPRNSGYQLIDVVDITQLSYTDKNNNSGLAAGATYCYRIVSLFKDTKSIVSRELCIGPVQRDAPVITHVTVENTADSGALRISWRSPIDINKDQFPEPYEYEVYRAKDFIGDVALEKIMYTRDTTIKDENINTNKLAWNYRIVLYAKPFLSAEFIPIDTSAIASSVKLSAISGDNMIQLNWQDSVPWSNVVQERPYHLIYRGTGIVPEKDLTLYDSANVIESGFTYTDDAVDKNEIYTYRIVTLGTYGNPALPLQNNFSQSLSIYPKNDLLPCAPIVSLSSLNCSDHLATNTCNQDKFENSVTWSADLQSTCRKDIVSYTIYASTGIDTAYTLLATIKAEQFTERDLLSPIRCYRIAAIDALGNEGPKSEPVCSDSCPYFDLPNVFTPNNDGCNDLFSSMYDESKNINADLNCKPVSTTNCPRFVKSIALKVYNRWGKEVFVFSSKNSGSVFIDWNGTDQNGGELASGIYYYVAEIDFEALEVSARHRTLKDWVHLVR